MLLLIDFDDSYIFNIKYWLETTFEEVCLVNFSEINPILLKQLNPTHLVLGPGPGNPDDYPIIPQILDRFVGKIPILGICLGHQALGLYFGMKLIRALCPHHGQVSQLKIVSKSPYFREDIDYRIVRYNSLQLIETNTQCKDIQIIATDSHDQIMSFRHRKFPILALQFHPESVGGNIDYKIIHNWKETDHNNSQP
ncbi:MAG: aminodeoxychorismate/anthranilate synthase component II [Chitinophagales bacterium]|nr:aminodeoxychorismate/anthranilate synthase component II [Chitinophagales bacterium]